MTEEEKKKTETDKAQAKARKELLIKMGLCLKCNEYIKPDERNMNFKGYCPTCQSNRKDKMQIIKVIKQLQQCVDKYGENVEVDFKMVAPENICDDDSMDIDIDFKGEIGTSLLPEKIEIGFTYDDVKDWSNNWKAQLRD